jgi:hypothetical protein
MDTYDITATLVLNKYLWTRLSTELDGDWKLLSGMVPIFPVQETPEAASQNQAYMVYTYSLSPLGNIYGLYEEQVTYTVYSNSEAVVRRTLNFMQAIFDKYYLAAEDVNHFIRTDGDVRLDQFAFKSIDSLATISAQPAESEGGRVDGGTTIRCTYTRDNSLWLKPYDQITNG